MWFGVGVAVVWGGGGVWERRDQVTRHRNRMLGFRWGRVGVLGFFGAGRVVWGGVGLGVWGFVEFCVGLWGAGIVAFLVLFWSEEGRALTYSFTTRRPSLSAIDVPSGRIGAVAVVNATHAVLLGGKSALGTPVAGAAALSLADFAWRDASAADVPGGGPTALDARDHAVATDPRQDVDPNVFVFGGTGANGKLSSDLFHLRSADEDQWDSVATTTQPAARTGAALAILHDCERKIDSDGKRDPQSCLVAFGGEDSGGKKLGDLHVLPETASGPSFSGGKWMQPVSTQSSADLPPAAAHASLTPLVDGSGALLFGGEGAGGVQDKAFLLRTRPEGREINLALEAGVTADSISLYSGVKNEDAIDGDNGGFSFQSRSCYHNERGERNPWYRVTLPRARKISYIRISNRLDCCSTRIRGLVAKIGNFDSASELMSKGVECVSEVGASGGFWKTGKFVCPSSASDAKYAIIYLPGNNRILNFCEMEVIHNPTYVFDQVDPLVNVATQGSVSQSSTSHGGVASRAIDSNPSGVWGEGSCTHTTGGQSEHWWELDLGASYSIEQIRIFNRQDCCSDRLRPISVYISDAPQPAFRTSGYKCPASGMPNDLAAYDNRIACTARGRYVTIHKTGTAALTLCEVQVMARKPGWPVARKFHSAMQFRGQVLVYGGVGANAEVLNDLAVFDAASNQWLDPSARLRRLGVTPPARFAMAFFAVSESQLALYGGAEASGSANRDLWLMSWPECGQVALESNVGPSKTQHLAPGVWRYGCKAAYKIADSANGRESSEGVQGLVRCGLDGQLQGVNPPCLGDVPDPPSITNVATGNAGEVVVTFDKPTDEGSSPITQFRVRAITPPYVYGFAGKTKQDVEDDAVFQWDAGLNWDSDLGESKNSWDVADDELILIGGDNSDCWTFNWGRLRCPILNVPFPPALTGLNKISFGSDVRFLTTGGQKQVGITVMHEDVITDRLETGSGTKKYDYWDTAFMLEGITTTGDPTTNIIGVVGNEGGSYWNVQSVFNPALGAKLRFEYDTPSRTFFYFYATQEMEDFARLREESNRWERAWWDKPYHFGLMAKSWGQGGSSIGAYKYIRADAAGCGNFPGIERTVGASATSATVTGLSGEAYKFEVLAGNAQGWSKPSAPSSTITSSAYVNPSLIEVARGKPTTQSSTYANAGHAWKAVDGNTNQAWTGGSVTHTNCASNQWWRVDLQRVYSVADISVWNRGDCCNTRLNGVEVRVGNVEDPWTNPTCDGTPRWWPRWGERRFSCNGRGRYVYISHSGNTCLSLAEVKVWAVNDQCPARSSGSGSVYEGSGCASPSEGATCKQSCDSAGGYSAAGGVGTSVCNNGNWDLIGAVCEKSCEKVDFPTGGGTCRHGIFSYPTFDSDSDLDIFDVLDQDALSKSDAWDVSDGYLHARPRTGTECDAALTYLAAFAQGADAMHDEDMEFSIDFRTKDVTGVFVRAINVRNMYRVVVDVVEQRYRFERVISGDTRILAQGSVPVYLDPALFHTLAVSMDGADFTIFLDGNLVTVLKDRLLTSGYPGIWARGPAQYRNVFLERNCEGVGCPTSTDSGYCHITCQSGWSMTGTPKRACSSDGTWLKDGTSTVVSDEPTCTVDPPSMGNFTLYVEENSARSSIIGEPVTATLEAPGQQVAYQIVDGNVGDAFDINLCSGQLSVREPVIDYETRDSYLLKIRAYVANYPTSQTYGWVRMIVQNVDEPPLLLRTDISARENSTIGTVAGMLMATDPEDDPISYEVVADGSGGRVGVENDGRVSVLKKLNYEVNPSFSLVVRAVQTTNQDLFTDALVLISVVDSNDDPTIDSTKTIGVVDRDAIVGVGLTPNISFFDEDVGAFAATVSVTLLGAETNLTRFLQAVFGRSTPSPDQTWTLSDAGSYFSIDDAETGHVVVDSIPSNTNAWASNDDFFPVFFQDELVRAVYGLRVRASDGIGGERDGIIPVVIHADPSGFPLVSSHNGPEVMETEGGENMVFTGTELGNIGDVIVWGQLVGMRYEPTLDTDVPLEFNASCEVTVDDTEITCETPEGAGEELTWSLTLTDSDGVSNSRDVTFMTRFTVSYEVPVVAEISNAGALSTAGGDEVTFVGQGFGGNGVPLVIAYGPESSLTVDGEISDEWWRLPYRCIPQPPTSHTEIKCLSDVGYGSELVWKMVVGGQVTDAERSAQATSGENSTVITDGPGDNGNSTGGSTSFQSTFSYAPAVITEVAPAGGAGGSGFDPTSTLSTSGGQRIRLTGTNFGPPSAPRVVAFAGSSGTDVALVSCQLTVAHTRIECLTTAFAGVGLPLSISVGGVPSGPSDVVGGVSLGFIPPTVMSVTGPGSDNANTDGGQSVFLRGTHFGPVFYSARLLGDVRYGPPGNLRYTAERCRVVAEPPAQPTIECVTAPGTGAGHSWTVEVGGQTSDEYAAMTSYGAPVIVGFTGDGATDASSSGGEDVVIEGRNFGPMETIVLGLLEVSYAVELEGGPVERFVFDPDACTLLEPHYRIRCITAPGAGTKLGWQAIVDSQPSTNPATAYEIPRIDTVRSEDDSLITDASPEGGLVVVLKGSGFGPSDVPFGGSVGNASFVQWVRYGKTGEEYTPTSFTVVSFTEIHMVLSPGSGSGNVVKVSVADQVSEASAESFDFASPEILSLTPANGPTYNPASNPTIVKITGTDFPIRDPLTDLFVLFGNGDARRALTPVLPSDPKLAQNTDGTFSVNLQIPESGGGLGLGVRLATVPAGSGAFAALQDVAVAEGINGGPVPTGLERVSDVIAGQSVFDYDDPVIDYVVAKTPGFFARSGRPAAEPCPFADGTAGWSCDDSSIIEVAVIGENFGIDADLMASQSSSSSSSSGGSNSTSGGDGDGDVVFDDGVNRVLELQVSELPEFWSALPVWPAQWEHTRVSMYVRTASIQSASTTLRMRLISQGWDGFDQEQEVEFTFSDLSPSVSGIDSGVDLSAVPTIGGTESEPLTMKVSGIYGTSSVSIYVGDTEADILYTDSTSGLVTRVKGSEDPATVRTEVLQPQTPDEDGAYTIDIVIPPGQGKDIPIIVLRDSQRSDTDVTLSYAPPSIDRFRIDDGDWVDATPFEFVRVATDGSSSVRLEGSNLGTCPLILAGASVVLRASCTGDSSAPLQECSGTEGTHTCYEFNAPAGEGTGVTQFDKIGYTMRLIAGDATENQEQDSVVFKFRYLPPTVTSIVSLDGFPTKGGVWITMIGDNFGESPFANDSASVTVEIGRSDDGAGFLPCANVDRRSHHQLRCLLPEGSGFALDVRISVAGVVGLSTGVLSYDPPEITRIVTEPLILSSIDTSVAIEAIKAAGVTPSTPALIAQLALEDTVAMATDLLMEQDVSVSAPDDLLQVHGPTIGAFVMRIEGKNFGVANPANCVFLPWINRRFSPLRCSGSENFLGEGEVEAVNVIAHDHESISFIVPEGVGERNVELSIRGAELSTDTTPPVFQYDAPDITGELNPTMAATKGGDVVTIHGVNFGPTPRDTSQTDQQLTEQFNPPISIADAASVPITYLRVDFHHTCVTSARDLGGARPPLLEDCVQNSVISHSHTSIEFKVPPGIGVDREVRVSIVDSSTGKVTTSNHTLFSYLPPAVVGLNPFVVRMRQPHGTKGSGSESEREVARLVDVLGENFGNAERMDVDQWTAEERLLDMYVNDDKCLESTRRREATAITSAGVTDSETVLSCLMGATTVGYKNLTIHVAGQVGVHGTIPRSRSLYAVCEVDYYGLPGEVCLVCPEGAECEGYVKEYEVVDPDTGKLPEASVYHTQPRPELGFFNLNSSDLLVEDDMSKACPRSLRSTDPWSKKARDVCVAPCEPKWSCVGDNYCARGYRSLAPMYRCSSCDIGFYRSGGECVKCPDNPWLLLVLFIVAAACVGSVGFWLSRSRIQLALLQIGIDYFQVLAIFATSRVSWPPMIKQLLIILSAFNLNIELTAPECLAPDISYVTKWSIIMAMPLMVLALLLIVHVGMALAKILSPSAPRTGRIAHMCSHWRMLVAGLMVMMYVLYLYITKNVFDIFNCIPTDPPDGNLYLQPVFEECGKPGGVQETLMPFAIIALLLYVIGFPAFVAYIIFTNLDVIEFDQVLRAARAGNYPPSRKHELGEKAYYLRLAFNRIYYYYRPQGASAGGQLGVAWALVILGRKFFVAVASLAFNTNSSFQLAAILLILFAAYSLQVRYSPFLDARDHRRVLWMYRNAASDVDVNPILADPNAKHRARVWVSVEDYLRYNRPDPERHSFKASKGGSVVSGPRVTVKLSEREVLGFQWYDFMRYNVVETVLLFCGILVTLGGIMFESGQFDTTGYQESRDAVTVILMIVIILSIVYFFAVFGLDSYELVNETTLRAQRLRTKQAKLDKAAHDRSKGSAAASEVLSSLAHTNKHRDELPDPTVLGSGGDEEEDTSLISNPLMLKGGHGSTVTSSMHTKLMATKAPPQGGDWETFRAGYDALYKRVQELSSELRSMRTGEGNPPASSDDGDDGAGSGASSVGSGSARLSVTGGATSRIFSPLHTGGRRKGSRRGLKTGSRRRLSSLDSTSSK